MRGLSRIRDIRLQGMKPEGYVSLWAPGTRQRNAFEGMVLCDPSDRPGLTDLRCLRHLQVHVVACGNGRFAEGESWAREVIKAGASTVLLSVETPPEQGYFDGPAVLRWNDEDIA